MKKIQTAFRGFFIALMLLASIVFFNISSAQFQAPPPPTSQPTPPSSLPAPKIISPKKGKIVSGNKVTLKWTAVPGATWYSYEMFYQQPDSPDFVGSGVPAGGSATTSAEFDLTGIPDGTKIRWLVSGSNQAIRQGGWVSDEAEFVYKKSTKKLKTRSSRNSRESGKP